MTNSGATAGTEGKKDSGAPLVSGPGGSLSVAVLMSVYRTDNPALLHRALRSIEEQDYAQGEVHLYLCVDGPVGEEIEAVIAGHRRHVHCLVRHDTNLGLARSLNSLIEVLEGEAFAFRMDGDDYSHPGRFSRQVGEMLRRPELDILGTAINEVDETGAQVRSVYYPKEERHIYWMLPRRSPLAHPTICFRRRAIETFVRYPVTTVSQDWALWFQCMKKGLILSNLDDVLVDMTVSDNFFDRRGASRASEEFKVTMKGIWDLYGVTWRMAFPIMRYLFRLCPPTLIRVAYNSRLR